jgi:hypothetical protein
MPYLVKAPKDERVNSVFSHAFKKVGEGEKYFVYEGRIDVEFPQAMFGLSGDEFRKLCRSIRVEGGFKKRTEDGVRIAPLRKKVLTVRLSEDEYRLLVEDAREVGLEPSRWARNLVMSLVEQYLALELKKKAMQEIREVCGGCKYWTGEGCGNPTIPELYLREVYSGRRKECQYKVERVGVM